jgi:hypothetical protein
MKKIQNSRIQREADQIIRAAKTDFKDILKDIPKHGQIMTYRESKGINIWKFEDGFIRKIPKNGSRQG